MFGRYEIRQEIGRGGMATVYLAYDPTFQRQVAVKVLPPHFLDNPLLRARFEREARLIATIEHPAIVPVYDFGEQEGQLYLVMRYMPGGSLAALIHLGRLSLAQTSKMLNLLAPALDAVHARGIVHRDLKPGNILLDAFSNPALSDFGIAHLSEATVDLTGEAIIGTPAYMSPEQVRAEAALDGRSDIYSLGIILYEMLTGRQPFQAATPMSTAMRHLTDSVPEISRLRPDLPDAIQTILHRALAKDREMRYAHSTELAFDLQVLVDAEPARGQPPRPNSERQAPGDQPIQAAGASIAATEVGTEASLGSGTAKSPPSAPRPPVQSGPADHQSEKPTEVDNASKTAPQRQAVTATAPVEPEKMSKKPSVTPGRLAMIAGAVLLVILIFVGIRSLMSPSAEPTQPVVPFPTETLTVILAASPTPEISETPAADAAAVAAATETVELAAQPTPAFSDDFSSPSSRWPQLNKKNGGYKYQDSDNGGSYVISVLEENSLFWSYHHDSYEDVRINVEAQRISGDQGYYGVLCRGQDDDNFYYFIVRPDGYFTIGKYEAGSFFPLTPGGWTFHEAIQTGNAVNLLSAECEGSQLRFSANGEFLGEAADSSFASGKVGLVAAALDASGFEASFDNFSIYSPVP